MSNKLFRIFFYIIGRPTNLLKVHLKWIFGIYIIEGVVKYYWMGYIFVKIEGFVEDGGSDWFYVSTYLLPFTLNAKCLPPVPPSIHLPPHLSLTSKSSTTQYNFIVEMTKKDL